MDWFKVKELLLSAALVLFFFALDNMLYQNSELLEMDREEEWMIEYK